VEIAVTATTCILVEESSQVGEARRLARACAESLGFDATHAEHVAIVATEAATNLLQHAGRGEILINTLPSDDGQPAPGLEILALDRGPGIDDLQKCLRDGYSTTSTPGGGLGAIFRLSTFADVYSRTGKGNVLLARWESPGTAHSPEARPFSVGAVNVSKPGQTFCGDSWGMMQSPDYAAILVADGLGHGYEASMASKDAVRVFRERASLDPQEIMQLAHLALRSSRGAAVAVARIDRLNGTLTFCGVGNISAQIYSGSQAGQNLVSLNGTVGHHMHQVRQFSYPWPDDGMLVLHSDGLVSATGLEAHPGLAARHPSLVAGLLYRDYARGNDDATVVVLKAF
jgi:anti-sigma regulatory factor (Ser/Thr protein kinase)